MRWIRFGQVSNLLSAKSCGDFKLEFGGKGTTDMKKIITVALFSAAAALGGMRGAIASSNVSPVAGMRRVMAS